MYVEEVFVSLWVAGGGLWGAGSCGSMGRAEVSLWGLLVDMCFDCWLVLTQKQATASSLLKGVRG